MGSMVNPKPVINGVIKIEVLRFGSQNWILDFYAPVDRPQWGPTEHLGVVTYLTVKQV